MTILTALGRRAYGWILGALAVLAAVAGVYLKGRIAGKRVERQKSAARELEQERAKAETIKEVHDVQTEVTRLPDNAVRERLRNEWQRD
jgi:Flp pilus assembly protein TadB